VEEQVLNAREWFNALLRHRAVIVGFAVLGLCIGLAYTLASPGLYTSKSLVLLPPSSLSSSGQPTRDIGTQAQIAMSPGILDRAGGHLKPPLGYSTLQHQVVVTSLTSDILQITAKGSNGAQAQQVANGVADAFIAYTTRAAASIPSVTTALQNESQQIQRQISDLQKEVNSTTAAIQSEGSSSSQAQSQLSLLTTLEQQQQNAALQLDSVNSQIAQTKSSAFAGGTGTTLLDGATPGVPPSHLRPVTYGILGILVGLLIGSLGALRAIRRDRRLRRRDDIVDVVGAPVLASVTLEQRRQSAEWIELFVRWEPSVEDTWTTRKLLHRRGDGPIVSNVTVIALAGDPAALALGPYLAANAVALGIPTTFVDDTEHECALALRRAAAVLSSGSGPSRAGLQVRVAGQASEPPPMGLVLNAVVLDQRDPLWPGTRLSSTTWLAISPGCATADELARVSAAAADSAQPISGIVIVNADPGDPTTGRFPAQFIDVAPSTNGHAKATVKRVAP